MLDELEVMRLITRHSRAPAVAIDAGLQAPALPFAYPVAVKILSAEIAQDRCRRRGAV
jgi:hypothetical protein